MKEVYLTIIALLIAVGVSAQTQEEATEALQTVRKMRHLKKLQNKYPNWGITADKTASSDSMRYPLFASSALGSILLKQGNPQTPKFVVKILDKSMEERCKLKYIYLDGRRLSKTKIDSTRTSIIRRHQAGEDFEKLVREFNMDGNPSGDLGWFSKGMMVKDFEDAVWNRQKGDVFTVDVEEEQWYYVVFKNYDNINDTMVLGIKIAYVGQKQ